MDKVEIKIKRKPETDEWLARVFINGAYSDDATYYTSWRDDAVNTALHMARQYAKQGYRVTVHFSPHQVAHYSPIGRGAIYAL